MHTWEIFSSNLLNESENSGNIDSPSVTRGLPVKFKNFNLTLESGEIS
jgi:hypothetical protein